MSDERVPQDESGVEKGDELMSDFHDLFSDDAVPATAAGPNTDEENPGPDVGLDGERLGGEMALDEGESEADPSVTLARLEEAVATAAVGATSSVASSPAPDIPPVADLAVVAPAISRQQLIIGVSLLSLSLLLSLAALWTGMGLGSQLEALNQSVSELQQRVRVQPRRGVVPPQEQLGEQLTQLDARVNNLAVIIEGPMSHLRESNQRALNALSLRLDRLEKGTVESPSAAAAIPKLHVVPAKESKALLGKANPEPEPATLATAPLPTEKKSGWVINLLSALNARTANEELLRLRKLGIRADKQTVNSDGKTWHRLRVTGFSSYEGAKAYIETVEKQTGLKSAWVGKE
ncbi:MAG: SPOR domain-containing protein [Pseudomonadota bacterium]